MYCVVYESTFTVFYLSDSFTRLNRMSIIYLQATVAPQTIFYAYASLVSEKHLTN